MNELSSEDYIQHRSGFITILITLNEFVLTLIGFVNV